LHSAFWLEHKLWGDNTFGYHLINTMQHAMAVCLLYSILLRLKIPGALLAAAIFAVHPIEVESIAWISEQKNTLSAIFYLAALRIYLEFDTARKPTYYAFALLLFVLGLLTKTVIATLPAALLVIFWWQRGTLSWRRDVLPLIPMFVLGAAAGLLTAWVERKLIGAEGAPFELTFMQRGLIAGRAIWFYLGKLLWPANLIFSYRRWNPDPGIWWQWLFPIAALLTTAVLWATRLRSRAPLAAWLFFVGTLFPVLGFLNVFPFIYSFVADHFQYLAGLGMIVLFASGATTIANRLWHDSLWIGRSVSAALIFVLISLTAQQSATYADLVKLYQTTIRRNPDCWLVYNNLGAYFGSHNRETEAEPLFREALRIRPKYPEALQNLGSRLQRLNQPEQAIELYKRALAIRPDFPDAEINWGNTLIDMKQPHEAIEHFQAASRLDPKNAIAHYNIANTYRDLGDVPHAIEEYNAAIGLQPEFAEAHFNLGLVLQDLHQLPQAVAEFRKTVEFQPKNVAAHANLMRAYATLNQPANAIAAARDGIAAAKAIRQPESASEIESWFREYQSQHSQSTERTPPTVTK
jgi:tetratricopeptide (TPR) repeat protein